MSPEDDPLTEAKAAITKLEALALAPGEFNHRAHVRMAWNYLRLYPLHQVLGRYSAALKAFATSAGAPRKYHQTITWALIFVVHERMSSADEASWEGFAEKNPDLFVWPEGPLSHYYSPKLLASDRARQTFVMPDRAGGSPVPAG